jgi:hypothetical protein
MSIKIIAKDILKGSKSAFSRRILKIYPIEPMMKQREIRVFEEIIENIKPKNILEFGSGYSTLYYPTLIKNKFFWNAIEHDLKWSEIIIKVNKNPNVKVNIVKPNNSNWKKIDSDGKKEDFKDYISFPRTLDIKFDLIIIDGRARKYCLKENINLLTEKGVIIIHDANRSEYYDKFDFSEGNIVKLLDQSKNHGGILIYSKENLDNFLNIKKHQKIWKKYNQIGKIPKLGKIILKIS